MKYPEGGLVAPVLGASEDERRYLIMATDRKEDQCPLVIGFKPICDTQGHKHSVATRVGYDQAVDFITRLRKAGWVVRVMDRTY